MMTMWFVDKMSAETESLGNCSNRKYRKMCELLAKKNHKKMEKIVTFKYVTHFRVVDDIDDDDDDRIVLVNKFRNG